MGSFLASLRCCRGAAAAGLLLVMGSTALSFAHAAAAETSVCNLSAWSTDPDPNGLAVRSGPGTGHAVIARLPPPGGVAGYDHAAEVTITGSQNGWFRISDAIVMDYAGDKPDKVLFKGEGWVSGRYLGLLLNAPTLHRGPSPDAPVVAQLSFIAPDGSAIGPDSYTVRLRACKGDWVEVDASFEDRHVHGWATRTCSSQVTTCP